MGPNLRTEDKIKLVIENKLPARERVYQRIRRDILDGVILPGDRLVEARLAERIKTSRTPVREAFHKLEMEGLLESMPRIGYRVATLQWNEVEEICEIRAVNETLAASWAVNLITDKELHRLEKNLEKAKEDLAKGNFKSFVDHDAEFHEVLVQSSRSKRLFELCQMLRQHMLRYRIQTFHNPTAVLRSIEGHKRILESLKARDAEALKSAVGKHLIEVKEDIDYWAFQGSTEGKPYLRGICERSSSWAGVAKALCSPHIF